MRRNTYALFFFFTLLATTFLVGTAVAASQNTRTPTGARHFPHTQSTDELDTLLTIGNGTGTMNFPFNASQRHTRTGMLYRRSEISVASGIISSIAFYANANYTYTGGTIEIWVKETADTGLTIPTRWDSLINGATRVDSISITGFTTGWNTITLQTPFVYSGQQDLLIGASSYVSATTTPANAWRRTAVTAPNECVGISSTDPWQDTLHLTSRGNRPNLQINITPTIRIVNPVPVDSAQNVPTNISFSWQMLNAVSADFYLDTLNPPLNRILTNQNVTNFTPTTLLFGNHTYYWRVFARNAIDSMAGPIWQFTTGAGAVDLIHPTLRHTPLGNTESPTARVAIAFINDNVGVATADNQPRLYHKLSTAGIWNFVTADSVLQDSIFYFTIPAYPLGSYVNYYLAAQDTTGNLTTLPADGSGSNPPGTTPPSSHYLYYVQTTLTGVHTIGATNADFTSIGSALTALTTYGIGVGGVTFTISNGTYADTARDIIVNTDSTRPVLFKPDSGAVVTLTFTGNTQHTAALRFIRARYVTIDGSWPNDPTGKHISMSGTGIDQVVWFGDSCADNTVKSCVLNLGSQTVNTYRTVQFSNGSVSVPIARNSLRDCDVIGGYYGVYLGGSVAAPLDFPLIDNCDIQNFNTVGIYATYGSNITVTRNWIHSTTTGGALVYGIYLNTGVTNSVISRNHIGRLLSTATGAVHGIRTYGTETLISNNMISVGTNNTGASYGIETVQIGGQSKIFFNSVWVSGTSGTGVSDAAYYNTDSTGTDSLWGNIFQNTRTGGGTGVTHTAINITDPAVIAFSNYNLLTINSDSIGDNRYVARLAGTNINTFDSLHLNVRWSSHDGNSFSEPAPFDSTNDLHILPTIATAIESGAQHHPLVPHDFDGDLRNNPMADIGADEGTFVRLVFATVQGTVRDSSTAATPIADATVRAGTVSAVTDSTGHYSMTVRSGLYEMVATAANCYSPDTVSNVQIDSGAAANINFWMLRPQITSIPTSIEMTVPLQGTSSTPLALSNPGNTDLTWHAYAVYGADDLDKVRRAARHGGNRIMETDLSWSADGYGYLAYDTADPRWPSFVQFRDISTIGTTALASVDDGGAATTMDGFTFLFYGTEWTSVYVCSNGFLQFLSGTTGRSTYYGNTALPTVNGAYVMPSNCILPLWDDLVASVKKYYDATNNVFILQWDGTAYTSGSTVQFQVQLFGNNNAIVFLYQTVTPGDLTPTIGIQNADGSNSHYLQCYYNNVPSSMAGYGIAFIDMSPNGGGGFQNWLTISPSSGTIAPHQVTEISVQATRGAVDTANVLSATIRVSNNACTVMNIPVTCVTLAANEHPSNLPGEYKLHQNYPNPFNPTTEIRFDLKQAGLTKLTVYDVLGREVVRLVDGQMRAGYYAARFNADRIATGVYFYRIESGNFKAVKKMVLVK